MSCAKVWISRPPIFAIAPRCGSPPNVPRDGGRNTPTLALVCGAAPTHRAETSGRGQGGLPRSTRGGEKCRGAIEKSHTRLELHQVIFSVIASSNFCIGAGITKLYSLQRSG